MQLLQTDLAARRGPKFGDEPLWAHLSVASSRALQDLVAWLARHRPTVYGAFADEDDLLVALADATERLGEQPWTLDELLTATIADSLATWIVVTPLIGVAVPGGVVLLDDDLALAPASDWPHRAVNVQEVKRRLEQLFGAPASAGSRYESGGDDKPVDTRRTASLVSREKGSRSRARQRALEQARLLVAGWTLLAPPDVDGYTPLWPQVMEWQPQPSLHVEEAMYRIGDDGAVSRRPGATVVYGPDDAALWPWPDGDILQRVLGAVRGVEESRAACALLSAAWNLYLAARSPSDLPWIERLVHTMHAREALCEPPSGAHREVDKRFRTACGRLEVVSGLRERGWGPGDLAELNGPSKRLRHLGVHGADVSLLRLGYPPGRQRIRLDSERLAGIYVQEAVSPAFHAVRELTLRLWRRMEDAGYDDDSFESYFGEGRPP